MWSVVTKLIKKMVFPLLFALLPVLAWSQAADELELIMNTKELSYGQAVRFVLEAADAAVLSDPEEAFAFARERQWLPARVALDDAARLKGISQLLMRAFALTGGLFYSLFPNGHYAYRELVHRQVIQDRSDPDMVVSGDSLLFMTGRMLAIKEDEEAAR
jgi:GNAT superfamily N-acetyltransferase